MTQLMPDPAERLVSFLGKGDYRETNYVFGGEQVSTRYVAHALSSIARPKEVVILATDEAWAMHGASLAGVLNSSGLPSPEHRRLPLGQNHDEIWQQFDVVVRAVTPPARGDRVLFDITHGFRSQPFFAAAAIDFVRSVRAIDMDLQVVYGAFEARQDDRTPIWDLTVFVDLLDWSRSLLLFLRTGRAEDVAAPTQRLGRELKKQWALRGQHGSPPKIDRLGQALHEFGDDLVTVRTGSLLSNAPQPGSARRLAQAIDDMDVDLERYIPPLAQVMTTIRDMVTPLITEDRLSEPGGQLALQALAQLYFTMGRYAEAAATLREAHVTRFASPGADCPGSDDYSDREREDAEKAWYDADPLLAKEIGDVRNNIEHAGYRKHPMPPKTIRAKVEELIRRMGVGDA